MKEAPASQTTTVQRLHSVPLQGAVLPPRWLDWHSRPDLNTLGVEGVSSAALQQAREALAAGEQQPGSLLAAGATFDRALAQAAAAVLALRQVHLPG